MRCGNTWHDVMDRDGLHEAESLDAFAARVEQLLADVQFCAETPHIPPDAPRRTTWWRRCWRGVAYDGEPVRL